MRANHFVTLGLCVGIVGLGSAVASCGTDTSGTCTDTNSCGPGTDGGADGDDVNLGDAMGDTGPTEDGPNDGGGDVKTDGPNDGSVMCEAGLHDCNGKCVNEGNDPNNCGACGKVCPAPDAGMATASCGGSPPTCGFMCASGYHSCNGKCLSDGDDPSSDPCVVADGLGIFVSPSGNDSSGNGSKALPYASIAKAASIAATGKKRVYACGTFTSAVALTSSDDGVTIYGGLDCTTWVYSASMPTTVAPSAAGYALQVTGAGTTGVTFDDFVFTAQSAPSTPPASTATAAQSSIAVFASQSIVKLTRVAVSAGGGQPGATGASTTNWSGAAAIGTAGALTTGGAGGQNACLDGTTSSTGGFGGGIPAPAPADGSSQPAVGSSNGGGNKATSCDPGGVGANGNAPTTQALGASTSGAPGSTGWTTSAPGANGSKANPAQGGGGGGSNAAIGAGGGGGAGGCGGAGGTGGASGGSSIAILSYQSSMTLTLSTVSSSAGGDGGAGGLGQDGQSGGAGAPGGGGAPQGCTGGNGGIGGGGGGGGGGAGGLSAGIVWSGGTAPVVDGTAISSQASGVGGFTTGTAGTVGPGGAGGQGGGNGGAAGTNGAAGQSADVVSM